MMATVPLIASARSFLFLPADRLERLPRALASGADAVVLDLEDGVAENGRAAARAALAQAVRAQVADASARLLVRINAAGTPWHEDDLVLLREAPGLAGAVLAKAESAAAAERVADCGLPVLALIESAEGLHAIDALAQARGVARLAFGHLDFQADLGLNCSDDERELDPVRLAFVLASRRAGLPSPVDGVTAALDDLERLTADLTRSRRFGYGAKLCIHPRQVEAVNAGLGPTAAEYAWAERVLRAAESQGNGAFRLEGEMVDGPVVLRARQLVAQARRG